MYLLKWFQILEKIFEFLTNNIELFLGSHFVFFFRFKIVNTFTLPLMLIIFAIDSIHLGLTESKIQVVQVKRGHRA